MLAIWIVLLIVVILYVGRYHWSRRKLYVAASKYDGPWASPIVGNGTLFLCKNEEILNRLYSTISSYNSPAVRLWLGPNLLVAFKDAHLVEKILSSSKYAYKHELYKTFKPLLGDGLVTSLGGQRHRQHRRFIQPLFDNNFCESFIGTFQSHIDICMKKLSVFVDRGTFDIHHVLHPCYDDIIADSVLGTKLNAQGGEHKEIVQALLIIYKVAITRFVRPWLYPDIIYNNSSQKTLQVHTMGILQGLAKKVLGESRQRRKLPDDSTYVYQPIVDRIDEHVKNNPEFMTEKELQDQLLTLLVASEDTMSLSSSFICVCFGIYPEYQQKVAEEIRQVFGDTPRQVEIGDISNLPYLDMCIKDALRLSPVAPFILRQNTEDTYVDDWFLPKDCAVVVPIYNIHRDPRYWEKPNDFHPDHFLPEAVKNRHAYSYLPFSAGSRNCIGKIFANLGLKVMLASLLQRYEIHAEGQFSDFKLKMDISTRPVHGYKLSLTKRVWR